MAGMTTCPVPATVTGGRLLGLAAIAAAVLLAFGIISVIGARADTAPALSTAQAQWQNAYDHAETQVPKPLLPPADRSTYVQDLRSWANCMQSQGISDFPDIPNTLGDGETPEPLISGPPGSDLDPSSSAYQAALRACPLTQHVPASDFEAAGTGTPAD